MSSMKKNILAVALVAGLGLAGAAAAYNYGTSLADDSGAAAYSDTALADAENVSYEMLVATSYKWTMKEGLVFDIETADNAAAITEGFTVRVALNQRCNPHNVPTNPASPPTNVGVCAATGDGAQFDPSYDINANAATDLILDPALVGQWKVTFDGYTSGNTIATFRIEPLVVNPVGPGTNGTVITFEWRNAHLTSLNEFAATAAAGGSAKVDAEFWMVNVSNDARFVNSTRSRTILESRNGVVACATPNPAEVDKYIDVADNWNEEQIPKTRFSWDGKLGSATDASTVAAFQLPLGDDYDAQVIDLGDVTLGTGAVTGTGTFTYWGTGNIYNGVADVFQTVIQAGGGNDWNAFDNVGIDDDVYLVNGTCASGVIIDQGTVSGTTVTFIYNAQEIEAAQAGFINVGGANRALTVCGYVDTDTIIDDHNNSVTTTFYRSGMYPANGSAPGDTATAYPTSGYANTVGSRVLADAACVLLPLRYNGSTMEIFTINPGSNTEQRSFVRLTNRGATDGYVSLEGIDNNGDRGASQVRVWVPAGASVQLNASDLEDGTNGAIGAWGTGAGKWRAVVTAEFPGLVATSLVNTSGTRTLSNITDSDTRGEQYDRDFNEGTFASEVGERPSDHVQEVTPDFHGNGDYTGEPGGPDADDGPAGGQTTPDGNPGL
ncbi:hypothetical protein [Thermomonas sp.]|uniref:hypothetical protein n=1 Tax=Thermomonas sp. TaxID=1971895 RepID=UPI0035B31260